MATEKRLSMRAAAELIGMPVSTFHGYLSRGEGPRHTKLKYRGATRPVLLFLPAEVRRWNKVLTTPLRSEVVSAGA